MRKQKLQIANTRFAALLADEIMIWFFLLESAITRLDKILFDV